MAVQPLTRRLPLVCCKIYISDTRNTIALQEIESTFRAHPKAPLLHVFEDHEYNRVGYTLAGKFSDHVMLVIAIIEISTESKNCATVF